MWHYCTKDKKAIAEMAFDIFDINDNGLLNDDELRLMVKEIYGKKGISHDLNTIVKKLDKNKDNAISKAEFVAAGDKFPALLFPAFHMQVSISTIKNVHSPS
jgi:Ca2+-binding EF-hand superfamily protein